MNNSVNTTAVICSDCARTLAEIEKTPRKWSTDPIRLGDVHVPVGIVVHLLVNAPDGFETEDGIFVLAQGLVDAAQLCKEDRRQGWGNKTKPGGAFL